MKMIYLNAVLPGKKFVGESFNRTKFVYRTSLLHGIFMACLFYGLKIQTQRIKPDGLFKLVTGC